MDLEVEKVAKKKLVSALFASSLFFAASNAQSIKADKVPASVKSALQKKYADAKDVQWEKEKGNYEANWGGMTREDTSATFSPAGAFIELIAAIPMSQLPNSVVPYVKSHYKGITIKNAGKGKDAKGTLFYEAEIKGKDLIFNENGDFIKED